jgi:hypothetical protein
VLAVLIRLLPGRLRAHQLVDAAHQAAVEREEHDLGVVERTAVRAAAADLHQDRDWLAHLDADSCPPAASLRPSAD